MIAYYLALVTLPVWAAGMAYGVARVLQVVARAAADTVMGGRR